MKKLSSILLLLFLCTFLFAGSSYAYSVTYEPSPSDIYDLDHDYAYEWGIDASDVLAALNNGEEIVSATLTFSLIFNYNDSENTLFVHLLNTDWAGLESYTDDADLISDYFSGSSLVEYSLGDHAETVTYTFSADDLVELYNLIVDDGYFGIGFDPDCHYFNDGISLAIKTSEVPEPATMLLLGTGLIACGGVCRKKWKEKK